MPDVRCMATACVNNSAEYTNDPRGGWCKKDYIQIVPKSDEHDEYADCASFEWDRHRATLSNESKRELIKKDMKF